ncbi:MAG: carbohydrate ABC transporter permease [Dehalococcoidia bacterium]
MATQSRPADLISGPLHPGLRGWWQTLSQGETAFAYLLMIPALVILVVFMVYPFLLGIWLSLTNDRIGHVGHYIGLRNFQILFNDSIFRQTVQNTFVYTISTMVLKVVLGMAAALLLNQQFRFRRWVRAGFLMPWIVPTALSALAWFMLFDSSFSPLSWALVHSHFHIGPWALFGHSIGVGPFRHNIAWLGDPTLGMTTLVIGNVWRGTPFFAISILAALQTIPPDLHEAASIDGARSWQRFRFITLPGIMAVLLVVLLFSIIWTFSDFQLIYVLTRGGPFNSTHVFGTYAYQIGLNASLIGRGAAISLCMLPVLAVVAAALLWYIRRQDV